ncbi:MAG: hypothetical protein ACI4D6_09440 [Chordicoccus sp.]
MRKIVIIIFITIATICVIVGIILLRKDNTAENRTKYLIDIFIKNDDGLDIDYIQMGIILPDGKKEIINTVHKEYNNMFHFTISYSSDTDFFLKGKASSGKEIEPCFFNLAGYSNVYEPQQIYFYIDDYKVYKE